MQLFRAEDHEGTFVGWGVRTMLLAEEGSAGETSATGRLAGFGARVEGTHELFVALEAMIDDPAGYGLFVMDCDPFGGLAAGRKAVSLLRGAGLLLPVILISGECEEQTFPEDRRDPIILRSPLSAVALRVGFEHALRDRMLWRAA